MDYREIVKKLCWILIIGSFVGGITLIGFGIYGLINKIWAFAALIIAGVLSPIGCIVSTYHIFLLPEIEDGLYELRKKVETLSKKMSNDGTAAPNSTSISVQNKTAFQNQNVNLPTEVIDYFKERYYIEISAADDLNDLKKKVEAISNDIHTVAILKSKVANATNKNELVSALIMHKSAHP